MRITSDLPDKERILLAIISGLASTQCLKVPWNLDYKDRDGSEHVHFQIGGKVQAGDLVLCKTSGIHEFTVAHAVTNEVDGCCQLREIGSNRICNMGNESFYVIRGMGGNVMFEGDQYAMYHKVVKAFGKLDEYWYRYGGVSFRSDGWVDITVRECFGGMLSPSDGVESVPFIVSMEWSKKTSVKKIADTLREKGVGTRKFERRNTATGELLSQDTLTDTTAGTTV